MGRRRGVWQPVAVVCVCLCLALESLVLQVPPATAEGGGLPTSRVGEGVYFVYATREGLVGGMTSSGHRIVEYDYFVSLPACTPQNCPRGAFRGQMTNCGAFCYVKVVNPANNKCRVEPIKDMGPWFTVDDWWNPTNVRYLNNLSTNPQDLPQGYTGADAARDGLNVGYGRSSRGIGYDDTHQITSRGYREVGNRAAIDLADGTWYNLGLTSPDRVGTRVFTHMLWQTGEDPASAAARCGHPLNQRGGSAIPLPTAPPTTPYTYPETPVVKVTPTPTFQPASGSFAVVSGTGGVGLRCRTAPSTGASIITTMPEGTRVDVRGLAISGWVPIRCANQDGWASASYLQVTWVTPTPAMTPTPTISPTATPAATPTATPAETVTPTATAAASETASPSETAVPSESVTETPIGTMMATATSTPTPPPASITPVAATEVPTGSAVVTGTGGLGLRCRTGPSTGSGIIMTIPEGTRVAVRGVPISGWVPIVCAGREGWASGAYLRIEQLPPTPAPTPSPTPTGTPTAAATSVPSPTATPGGEATAVVSGTGGLGLRCRTGPSTGAGIITTLPEGSRVTVRGIATSGWLPIRCANQDGWASATYLRLEQATPIPTPTSTPGGETTTYGVVANAGGSWVRCRTQASLSSTVIASYPEGTQLALRGPASGDWQPVRCDGRDGYMWAAYIEPVASAGAARTVTDAPVDSATEDVAETQPAAPATNVPPTPVPPTLVPAAPTAVPVTGYAYIASQTGEAINCRIAPSTDADVITTVEHGAEIAVRGDPGDGWQGVVCGGQDGFVASQFISPVPPPTAPPVPTEAPLPVAPDTEPGSAPGTAPETESYPPGSDPWFPGSPLAVADAWSDAGATSAWDALDGREDTAWTSQAGAGQAILTLDLGAVHALSGVRWMFAEAGGADSMRLQVSLDGGTWSQLVTTSNRQAWSWEGWPLAEQARYVRLVFDNPGGDLVLGHVAEVEVWGLPPAEAGDPVSLARSALVPALPSRWRLGRPGYRSDSRGAKGATSGALRHHRARKGVPRRYTDDDRCGGAGALCASSPRRRKLDPGQSIRT